ncbi:hypothetical protein Srubr_45000 [Streptomyces rubradiris]|uniref:Uncharacterized protein n=1 Tax=Streptomyces rubradiris TaxID=285531 RepID=A0ABQ3RFQ8_STRRR|nr:hypothetical protein GCM10018792_07270 [Streptomyces rubradiris]GHI54654.1 hypothetical protein Srubr_45000 [Streptomyces rubradiris]
MFPPDRPVPSATVSAKQDTRAGHVVTFLAGSYVLRNRADSADHTAKGPTSNAHSRSQPCCPTALNRKGTRQPWESSGISLGLPASSTGTSLKELKDHSRRSAANSSPSPQVTTLPGLFRDI